MATGNKITMILLRVANLDDPRLQNVKVGEHFILTSDQAIYWKDPADNNFKPLSAVPKGQLITVMETNSTIKNGKTILQTTYTYADGSTETKETDLGDLKGTEGRVGPKGDTGTKGDPGPQGIQGIRGYEKMGRPPIITLSGRKATVLIDLRKDFDIFIVDRHVTNVTTDMSQWDTLEVQIINLPNSDIARSFIVMFGGNLDASGNDLDFSGKSVIWKVQRKGVMEETVSWHAQAAPLLGVRSCCGFLITSDDVPITNGIFLGTFSKTKTTP